MAVFCIKQLEATSASLNIRGRILDVSRIVLI